MKTIQILSISLTNFKGLRNQKIVFNKNTDIFGANGTGKTTIMDAFLWMLFGKDSTDRKNFEIKTLDKLNVVIPQIEHEVSAIILVDDVKIEISRILSEMWPKKKGSNVAEFSGNKTEFYWDGVPMQEKTFQEKVSTILDETVFKMITNPLAFNAMKWQDQRNVLVDIAGTISDEDLAAGNSEYEKLIAELTNGKTLSDYEKQILASIKKAKEDLKMIPARIDEVSKSKPETHDFVNLKVSLGLKETELKKVDESIQNKNSAFDGLLEEINKKKSKANGIKSDIETIESNARRDSKQNNTPDTSALDSKKRELASNESDLKIATNGLNTLNSKVVTINTEINNTEAKIVAKRNDWGVENAKELTFNDDDFHCPTCKRDVEAGDVENKKTEMLINFKTGKANNLERIQLQGKALSDEKESFQKELKTLQERISNANTYIGVLQTTIINLKSEIETETSKITPTESVDEESVYQQLLSGNHQYQDKKIELKNILATIDEVPKVDISELQTQRAAIVQEIDNIKSNLRNEDQIKAVDDRVKVLEKEQKDLAQQIANVEKTQFVIEKFNKLKIDTLESKINEKFKFVKFRMFKSQINGGETECCDALIDGVPFSDANTASKINAGLDIINTLCEFYQVTAPIFIDNRESIIDVIELNSQLINLIVSGDDKKLRVA
ncbi:MAG: AAA family ATPase [Bacteroidota bacterium]